MDAPPPPPPPHGATPGGGKSGGLPDGKYDIFVIPPSSAGSGFLYLPSLQTQRNSFIAGVACTAAAFFVYSVAVPALKQWFNETLNGSGSGVMALMAAIAVVSWAWGKTQAEGTTGGGSSGSSGGTAGATPGTGHTAGATPGAGGFNTGGTFTGSHFTPGTSANGPGSPGGTKPTWQRTKPQTTPGASAKNSWEKAREETRKKEEERRRTEELKKKREELEKDRQKLREKEARERIEREAKAKAEAAAKAKAAEEKLKSSPKKPPMPSARTEQDDDAYSFRPYDRQKHKANSAASVVSESSYAPSATTAKTTPPPSQRGPYSTKDPDKIIIKAVYSFNNAFMKVPISQLISGQGNVTDGLILRITTEGLFIDDDVRGVPQREWDVKAWTMKLAEVWCPSFAERTSSPNPRSKSPRKKSPAAAPRLVDPIPTLSREDNLLVDLDWVCRDRCREAAREAACEIFFPSNTTSSRSTRSTSYASSYTSSPFTDTTATQQSCEMNGLHILRASIRDQEGKKYVFVLSQSEGWKVAIGLQRLRRGTQVRALGVAGLPLNEAKTLIQNLGWT